MAGNPKKAALVKTVTKAGGEEALLERIEAGHTIAAIAKDLGLSRTMLSTFLNRDPDSQQRLARARETSAHALVEEAMEIADSATHEDDRAKRLQVSTRQWVAGKYNRPQFGESPLVNVGVVNADALMLAALQQAPPPKPDRIEPRPRTVDVSPALPTVEGGDMAQIEAESAE